MSKSTGHILIIDDNASVLNSLDLFLKYQFEKISILKNPNQIVSFLQKEVPDVIILDMNFTGNILASHHPGDRP
jgi:two-component system response regulator HydG